MGLKEDYRLKKLKKEMHKLHCEVKKCCDGGGGDGLTCDDLENCQEIIDIKDSIPTDVSDLTDDNGKLFDGDYDSLVNKPTFKTVDGQSIIGTGDISVGDNNVQSDWNEADSSSDAFIKNKPSIPIVNDGQLELNTSGIATGGSQNFSANQVGNTTFTVYVPGTDITLTFNNNILTVSSSTGQSDSIDLSSLVTDNTYVTSMSLSGNTLILTNNDNTTVQQDLSSILFDGDYNNLINKPTIPTNTSELVNDSGYLSCEDLEKCQEIVDIKDSIPTIFIERSLPDLRDEIANNELVPGATYKITGVHKAHIVDGISVPALYDDGRGLGTTIFLKAVSENKLESYGSGIFYNPKYDLNTPGYGIWTNKVFVTLSNVLGDFDFYAQDFFGNIGETVTADNGAVGRILSHGQIVYVSGDWANATSITGDYTGATADINSVSVPSYAADDVVFWGGYSWKNLNGNIGLSNNVLNLDSEWEKLDYTDSNYDEVVDYIEYDINNDFITRRRNEEYNIDVNQTFGSFVSLTQSVFVLNYPSISVMNYGLGYDPISFLGINGVKVNNSCMELVNFRGGRCLNANFDNNSYLAVVDFNNNGSLQNANFDNNSYLNGVDFDNNSHLTGVNFDNNSRLTGVNFDNNSHLTGVNFDNNSFFDIVRFDNSSLQNVNFDSFIIFNMPTLLNKSIRITDFKGVGYNLSLPDLSSATVIFNNNIRKEVIYIQGATNNCKLITYDTSGNRVVNDITD